MSTANEVNKTSNFLQTKFDVSKIFVFNNRFSTVTLNNASGGTKSFAPGLTVARIAATGKVVPFDGTAVNGAQIPIGILASDVIDLPDTNDIDVSVCVGGDVSEPKIILEAGTLDSVVTIGTGTENTRIVRDMIQSLFIKIVPTDELTNFDNQ